VSSLPDLSRLTPTGGKRSSKREQIVNVFLRQEGHLSADDLVDLIRKEDHRISRATVYRTLQWMVDAGIARKVDFGEGRFRFEHSYRQPRLARDALRIAIATERSGLDFYTRAAKVTKDARGRKVFQDLALEEKEHLGKLETRYAELLRRDPQLESRPTFLFFKGAANGLFAEGADRLMRGVNDQQALMIGIRCERGSHRFFKKYGERFEDSEGKQIFLEFADEERDHLDLLIREYRALVKRQGRSRRGTRSSPATARVSAR
jgi:rubrerythrin